MAFGKSQESAVQSNVSFKKYYGIGNFFVKAINPNAKEVASFYGTEEKEEPTYTGTVDVNGENVKSVRIQVMLEYAKNDENDPIDLKTNVTFFLRYQYRWNKDHTKFQVIDKYGYTGWATKEQLDSHAQLKSHNGNDLRITNDYRPALDGEEQLTNFIKIYLNIPEARSWDKNIGWIMNPKFIDYSDCECRLDEIKSYFDGNFKELKGIPTILPKNRIKCLVGIKNSNDKEFMNIYTKMFLTPNTTDYKKLQADVESSQASGAFQNMTFNFGDLKEYIVESTNFNKPEPTADPFGNTTTNQTVAMPEEDDELPF